LEDIRLSYSLPKRSISRLPFKEMSVYFYANNLGTIWVANKHDIDPYFNNTSKVGKALSMGFTATF
jgi:TonB-dependent starch-binding outer membrane protein SusC